VLKNKDLYTTNQEIRNINTRSDINLHPQVCNWTVFQKGVYFSGIKQFNHLPQNHSTTYHKTIQPPTTKHKKPPK
jgi:hypothetical protein